MTSRLINAPRKGSALQFPIRWLSLLAGLMMITSCRSPSKPSDGLAQSSEPSEPSDSETIGTASEPKPVNTLTLSDPVDPADAQRARRRLVRHIQAQGEPWHDSGPWSEEVLGAMLKVRRHLFMPGASIPTAYADRPDPIGYGQTISQPTVVAIMTEALSLSGSEKVLEIGTGSGYQAAVLSLLAGEVYSIEIVEPLGLAAKKRLAELGYKNVTVRVGDGYRGWPEQAPFDRIILTAAPPEMPPALISQLREGGIIVAPVGTDDQTLVRWTKRAGQLDKADLGAVRFVPMVPKD